MPLPRIRQVLFPQLQLCLSRSNRTLAHLLDATNEVPLRPSPFLPQGPQWTSEISYPRRHHLKLSFKTS
jgi:hypothetical protein